MSTTFDPATFKSTTRAQWETAANAWHRWGPAIEVWLGAATEQMLDDARLTPGSGVLDVAAGAGGQTLSAARRVGPTGRVLATDISPAILRHADAETIAVDIHADAHRLRLRIADDGRGLPAERRPGANGLFAIESRAATIGATVTFSAADGERGTAIELLVPLHQNGAPT